MSIIRQTAIAVRPVVTTAVVRQPSQITSVRSAVGLPGRDGSEGSSGDSSYEISFTQSSLTIANLLPVTHSLNSYPSGVSIWDDNNEIISPDGIDFVSVNALAVDLSSFAPISGAWRISISK